MYDPSKQPALLNYSGCGNTINANHPTVAKLIIDSLVHWVTEYHIDGFRFDLASCLCRDQWGNALPAPPLIRAISKHPLLSRCKLIAEPWDLGMYQVRLCAGRRAASPFAGPASPGSCAALHRRVCPPCLRCGTQVC